MWCPGHQCGAVEPAVPLDSGNQGRADLAPGEGPAVARKVNPRTFGFQESRERSRLVLVSLSHPTPRRPLWNVIEELLLRCIFIRSSFALFGEVARGRNISNRISLQKGNLHSPATWNFCR